jgi:hypothetical protein
MAGGPKRVDGNFPAEAATLPTTAKARWDHDVILIAVGKIRTNVWIAN